MATHIMWPYFHCIGIV